jgi:hypothetical protein
MAAEFPLVGVVSPNPRKFRHPNSNPATIACRSMTCPSPRRVSLRMTCLCKSGETPAMAHSAWASLIAPEILEPICR